MSNLSFNYANIPTSNLKNTGSCPLNTPNPLIFFHTPSQALKDKKQKNSQTQKKRLLSPPPPTSPHHPLCLHHMPCSTTPMLPSLQPQSPRDKSQINIDVCRLLECLINSLFAGEIFPPSKYKWFLCSSSFSRYCIFGVSRNDT